MKGFGITDKGLVRKENQDYFSLEINPENARAVFVVCDGMGGARAGSVASKLGAEAFLSTLDKLLASDDFSLAGAVEKAAEKANSAVYERSCKDMNCRGMGTTLVGGVIRENALVIANVGDSRAYFISHGAIRRITRDHSLVEDLVLTGDLTPEEAWCHPKKNLITRALGVDTQVDCDIFTPEYTSGDMLLLCSDGLSNMVTDQEMLDIAAGDTDPQTICEKLLGTALERGAPDNVTVLLLVI